MRVLKYYMRNREAICDACNAPVDDYRLLTEYASDLICPMCLQDLNDHFNADDLGDSPYGDDSWVDLHDGWADQYDDDPNPYHGTYSEE